MRRAATILLLTFFAVSAVPLHAADEADSRADVSTGAFDVSRAGEPLSPIRFGAPFRPGVEQRTERGAVLPALYVSIAAFNAFDAWSTSRAVGAGAREGNPVIAPIAGNPTALWIVKGAATASAIVVAERLWKSGHRGKAIALMGALNGAMALVAARNAAVLRSLR